MEIREIAALRQEKTAALLREKGLRHLLIVNAGREKYNTWLLGPEVPDWAPPGMGMLPMLPPFNRNTLYFFGADQSVRKFSAVQPHPTDIAQDPVFCAADASDLLSEKRIGIVNADCLKEKTLQEIRSVQPDIEFVDLSEELDVLKAQRSPEELEWMEKGAALFDRAFSAIRLCLRAGFTEQKAVCEFRWRLDQLGVSDQDLSLLSVVRMTSAPDGGPSAEEPLTYPGRILTVGDRVNVSCTSFTPGGSAALGRCYILGTASEEARQYWNLAVEAQDAAAAAAVPGAALEQAAAAGNAFLTANGMPEDHSAWIHGIGADRFEAPRNTDSSGKMKLSEGMTLVIGPSVCPPGKDPYCCMDVYAVRAGGAVRLGKTDRALMELF